MTEDTLEMEAEGSGCSSEDYGRLEATIRMDSLRGHRLIVLVASTLQGMLHGYSVTPKAREEMPARQEATSRRTCMLGAER